MQRWKLTLEYVGGAFAGWQRQNNIFSIQECLETAIERFCGEKVIAHVAGRTDAGVHACGQVAHVDLTKSSTAKTVRDALNFHMRPYPVAVLHAQPVTQDFHARFSAIRRVYRYRLLIDRHAAPILNKDRVWHVWKDLNVESMNKAAKHLLGTHDFSSFRAAECQAQSPLRSLDRLEFLEVSGNDIFGRTLDLWVEARSFLHHQVRNMVGTLKMVGEGKLNSNDMPRILAAKDRRQAGVMAPAYGLYLMRVDYPEVSA